MNPGNCIFAALARITTKAKDLRNILSKNNVINRTAESNGCRSYRDVQTLSGVWLEASTEIPFQKGYFLLHCENGGSGHCIALVIADNERFDLYDDATNLLQMFLI